MKPTLPPALAALTAIALLAAAARSEDPPSAPPLPSHSRTSEAKAMVRQSIVAPLTSPRRHFSRAPFRSDLDLEFRPMWVKNGEARLPFHVFRQHRHGVTPVIRGYVRLDDLALFVLHPDLGRHVTPAKHPSLQGQEPTQNPSKPATEPSTVPATEPPL